MDIAEIERINRQTLEFARERGATAGQEIVGSLRREHPFFGLVEVEFPNGGTGTLACFNDDAIALTSVWNGGLSHERFSLELWQGLVSQSEVALDVGAYTGVYTLAANLANPRTAVYAFEPVPHIFARLIMNVSLNRLNRVRCVNSCVSDRNGEVSLRVPIGPTMFTSGSSVVEDDTDMSEQQLVRSSATRLDTWWASLPTAPSGRIGAVKIDVEQHEPAVLRGARDLFSDHRPRLLIEVLSRPMLDAVSTELPPGYGRRFILEDERRLSAETDEFFDSHASMNVLFASAEELDVIAAALDGS